MSESLVCAVESKQVAIAMGSRVRRRLLASLFFAVATTAGASRTGG